MSAENTPFETINDIQYFLEFEITDRERIEEFIEHLESSYPGEYTWPYVPDENNEVVYELTCFYLKFSVPHTPSTIKILMAKDNISSPVIIFYFDNEGEENPVKFLDTTNLTKNFLAYLKHRQQNPEFDGDFFNYPHEPISMSQEIGRQQRAIGETHEAKARDAQITELIKQINSSMAELVSRTNFLNEVKRKKLLADLNIPNELVKKEMRCVLEFDDRSTQSRVKPTVTFIHPSDDQVVTSFTRTDDLVRDEPIDIFKKIREDLNNIKNPFIFAAIQRWANTIRYQHIIDKEDYNIAKRHIEKVCEIIIAKVKSDTIPEDIAFLLSVDRVEIGYLKAIWNVLLSDEVKAKRRKEEKLRQFFQMMRVSEDGKQIDINVLLHFLMNTKFVHIKPGYNTNIHENIDPGQTPSEHVEGYSTPSNGVFYVQDRLWRCIRFVEFLASDDEDVKLFTGKSFDKMSWESFRNAFIAWRSSKDLDSGHQLTRESVKTYISRAKSKLRNLNDETLAKLMNDSLYKYGALDGNDRSLKNNQVAIDYEPATEKLTFVEGLPAIPYIPPEK